MPMKHPPHPGLSIQHDCLEPFGPSVDEGARKLDVSQEQLSDILNGYSGISLDMAVRLNKGIRWRRHCLAAPAIGLRSRLGDAECQRNRKTLGVEQFSTFS